MHLANCNEHPADRVDPTLTCWALRHDDLRRVTPEEAMAEIQRLRDALKPWGSGGIITGTVLAWIAAKDPAIAKAIVYGKAAVDRALNP